MAAEGKAPADPLGRKVRPGEDTVVAPDLDAQDVRALDEIGADEGRRAGADAELRAVDEPRRKYAVRVLREGQARVIERLLPKGASERGAEDKAADRQDDRAHGNERPQERERSPHSLRHSYASHDPARISEFWRPDLNPALVHFERGPRHRVSRHVRLRAHGAPRPRGH